ncbi:MAG: response regulator [Chloroflexi bacterium]|nr:response regulator [Chloroflexota bacterium]MBM4451276.1 response regulator [Chloroflexota bacterium]
MGTLSQERPRVLIVDDQPNWREALCVVLDPTRYQIETAANYDEAKHRLQQRAFHVLVADQRLVDSDESNREGILLLDEVNGLQDGTQAIIVTGYPSIDAAKDALKGRAAYDYIRKWPEKGEPPFDIQYRERVKEAAEKAGLERRKAITLGFSLSMLINGLTYEGIAENLFPAGTMSCDVVEGIRKVVNRLFYPLQPLARQVGKVWLSVSDQICEILCWSREYSKAALLMIGKEQGLLEARKVPWLKESWRLIKDEQFVSVPIVGISYTIDGMEFEDFAALVEED